MEIILNTRTLAEGQQNYQDGDIVCAISKTQTHYCHGEMICHVDLHGFNSAGLRDRGTLLENYMALTSKYRFTRLNSNEVQKYNLLTDEVDIISDTPNEAGNFINVYEYLIRRLSHKRHKIFGDQQGAEVWYGGNAPRDRGHADVLWDYIEGHSDKLKVDHSQFPLSPIEKAHFLPIDCCGFMNGVETEISDGTCGERDCCVEIDGEPDEDGIPQKIFIAKKKWQVPYWDLASELGIDVYDARDRELTHDGRTGMEHNHNHMDDICVDKVAAGIVTI